MLDKAQEMPIINNGTARINFFEFSTEVNQKFVQALKVFANVKDPNDERTRNEWRDIFNAMLVIKTK